VVKVLGAAETAAVQGLDDAPSRTTETGRRRRRSSTRSEETRGPGPALAASPDHAVDLLGAADVDTDGRLVSLAGPRPRGFHFANTTFCWFPPKDVLTWSRDRRLHLQGLIAACACRADARCCSKPAR